MGVSREFVIEAAFTNTSVLASLRRALAMAYRRKLGAPKATTFEDFGSTPPEDSSQASPELVAQAIRASAAHRDSSLSSAYGESAFSSAYRESNLPRSPLVRHFRSFLSISVLEIRFCSDLWESEAVFTRR